MNNKDSIIVKIVILSIVGLSLISLFITLLLFSDKLNFNFFKFNSKSELIFDEIYPYNNVTDIDVYTISSNLNIIHTTDDQIKIVVYGNKEDKVVVKSENNKLYVDADSKNLCIGFCFHSGKVDIYLPQKYQNNLTLKTTSGDINVEDYLNANLAIKTVSGEVKVGRVGMLKTNSTSGDINVNTAKNLNLSTISGEISVDNAAKSFIIKTTSGDIRIGKATLTKNSKISTISGEVVIDRLNQVYVDTSTISGDININDNNRKADIVLTIKTTSGDISIN